MRPIKILLKEIYNMCWEDEQGRWIITFEDVKQVLKK